VKFISSRKPTGSTVAAWGLAAHQSSGGETIVLCIVCFVYSSLSVVVGIVVVLPLLSS